MKQVTLLSSLPLQSIFHTMATMIFKNHILPLVKNPHMGTSLEVQWLGLCASTAGGTGSIPGWEAKIPHAAWCSQTLSCCTYDTFQTLP